MTMPIFAEMFQGEEYYNNYAFIVCGVLVLIGGILLFRSKGVFRHRVQGGDLPSVSARAFWRRVWVVSLVFFGLSISLWVVRGWVGPYIYKPTEASANLP